MSSYSDLKRGQETWISKVFRIVNSIICFILAFISVNYLSWFAMAFVGKFFKCDAIVYSYGIKFITPVDPELFWNKIKIILIFSTPVLFPLLFGLACLYIYDKTKGIKSVLNLYLAWGFMIGTITFATQNVIASLGLGQVNSEYYRNLAVVYSWLRIPIPLVYILNIPFAIVFLYFSKHAVRPFLLFAYSFTKVNKLSRRRKYYIETMALPFILGSIIVLCLKFYVGLIHDMFIILLYFVGMGISMLYGIYSLGETEIMKDEVLKYKSLQEANYFLPVLLIVVCGLVYLARQGVYLSFN